MAYERSRHVFQVKTIGWVVLLFLFCLVYALWFAAVLYAEDAGWEPVGRWAVLPTRTWAILGLTLFALVTVYYLALLARREVPARVYVFEGTGEAAPSFLSEPQPEKGSAPTPPPQG